MAWSARSSSDLSVSGAGRLGQQGLVLFVQQGRSPEGGRPCDAIRQPIDIGDGRTVTVGVSTGVALRTAGGDAGLDALTAEADAGMYRDKRGRTVAA
ncbi:GGDEF domain-containing protein [Actinoplanes xinjiangensis]|uniref:GGDEF domain-containing protein n=1 Tax=Actinoplanes xinjiangensis TaxID=512350 RepID=A0A316F914_9ACTN|nr:GGDEF domain-containing protein [Actinoplanes xinjiangensis]PWK42726.1 hypothetical protein BC793_114170 [Actinoplanes xinjiangensis]GIF38288.1 hypothetical protein Axi01nite_25990 [Actinoplanes xinjiangensis]